MTVGRTVATEMLRLPDRLTLVVANELVELKIVVLRESEGVGVDVALLDWPDTEKARRQAMSKKARHTADALMDMVSVGDDFNDEHLCDAGG